MIMTFAGTPGSGKTYDTVRKILDNLKLGRKIYTNVDGLDVPECREFIKIYTGLDDYQLASQLVFLTPDLIVRFWETETVVVNKGTDFESKSSRLICERGSLIVLDEVHKFFSCRDWQSSKNKGFGDWASTHRHDGYDVVLVTQDIDKVDKQVRSLVEWTYVYRKVNFLGSLFSNAYLVYSFTGDDTSGKPLATQKKLYDKRVFQCYQSYTSKDMKELGIMKHTNVLKHPVFYSIPIFLAVCVYMIFFKSSFATGDVFGAKKMLEKKQPLAGAVQAVKGHPPSPALFPPGAPAPLSPYEPPRSAAAPGPSFPPQSAFPLAVNAPGPQENRRADVVTRADLQELVARLKVVQDKQEKQELPTIDWRRYDVDSVIEINGKVWYSIRGKIVSDRFCRAYDDGSDSVECFGLPIQKKRSQGHVAAEVVFANRSGSRTGSI